MIDSIPLEDFSYGFDASALDPASLNDALKAVVMDAMSDPMRMTTWTAGYMLAQQTVAMNALRRMQGDAPPPAASSAAGDKRFSDASWTSNPALANMLDAYLVQRQYAMQLVETSRLPETTRRKARFALTMMLDSLAPSNVPWMNPAVIKEAVNSNGESLKRGMTAFFDDVKNNGGFPQQVDASSFELGTSLAATPGTVVFRNNLIELIAYTPQTETVFERPLLMCPPWINKYYIMDLAPGRSLVEWAVQHGHQTFMISYRNPDASMRDYKMDDYLREGPLAALAAIERLTGAPKVDILALCLGGTLAVTMLAYLAKHGQADRIGTATLTNTLVDFAEPGDLGVFTDEASISKLEAKMNKTGFLDSKEMEGTFNWMRANDLIWSYVVSNWFMGKKPPAFDILAWNGDATRMPAAMHSQYLRACYLHNLIVKPDAFVIDDTPIDLGAIQTPLYVLGAEADHIAPWRSSYATTQYVGGESRYVRTNAGHVAGVVNPPGNAKACYWEKGSVEPGESPDEWLAGATKHQDTWWNDWAAWSARHAGEQRAPWELPAGDAAPGSYIRNETAEPIDLTGGSDE